MTQEHLATKGSPLARLFLLSAVVVALFLLSLVAGSVIIPVRDVLTVLLGGDPEKASWGVIVLQFRLPRALTALLAGAALAVSGLQMQTLFRNPLAGPFVLGISAGASLGVAVVVLVFGAGASSLLAGLGLAADLSLAAAAALGSGAVLALVFLASRRVQTLTLLILGVLFGYGASALVSILLHFSIAERIQLFVAWTFGSFAGVTWDQLLVLAPVLLLGLLLAGVAVKPMNALLLGESYAESLGVAMGSARLRTLVSTALLAGGVTAFCGPIAFLGVAVPHLARGIFRTSDHRVLMPGALLLGACVALSADLVAQLPGSPLVLPLNAVTALVGTPVVAWVVLSRPGRSRQGSASL